MKKEFIKRPKQIPINEKSLRMEIYLPKQIFDDLTGELIDILIAPSLVLSEQKGNDEKFPIPIDHKMFNDETYKRFNNFTYSLGKMVRLAELNLDNLIGVVKHYNHLTSMEEILKRNSDCQKLKEYDIENNFHKLTYGNLRNILSCIVKTDKDLYSIEGLETTACRKNFTTVYKNYIDDRDCYTHGILFFLYPSMEPILRVKTNEGNNIYIKYEKEVFTHNLMTFEYLSKIIADIRQRLNSRLKEELRF
jgi:hypothetical protein